MFRCKFLSMFPVFHLAWSTYRATKTFVAGWRKLLRKVERGSTWATNFGFVARFSSNSQLVAQQICSCPSKSTNQRAAFLQHATNVFVAGQVDQAKTRNIDQNLQRNNVTRQVEGYCISHFAAFSNMAIGWVGRKFANNLQTALKESLALFPVDELNWKRSTEQRLADEKNLVICKSVAGYRHSCQLFRTI